MDFLMEPKLSDNARVVSMKVVGLRRDSKLGSRGMIGQKESLWDGTDSRVFTYLSVGGISNIFYLHPYLGK